jgi:hypothetical protein
VFAFVKGQLPTTMQLGFRQLKRAAQLRLSRDKFPHRTVVDISGGWQMPGAEGKMGEREFRNPKASWYWSTFARSRATMTTIPDN